MDLDGQSKIDGSVDACIVAKKKGIPKERYRKYEDTFSLVVRFSSIYARYCSSLDFASFKTDVKKIFFN